MHWCWCISSICFLAIVNCTWSENRTRLHVYGGKCPAIDMAVINGSYIFWRDPCNDQYVDETLCKPRCNLVLHAQSCPYGTSEDVCIIPNDVCKSSGFWCSKYDISSVSAAANYCLSNVATINQCSRHGSCPRPKLLEHSKGLKDTCRNFSLKPTTSIDSSLSSLPAIPITEAELRVLSGSQESLHYVKTFSAEEKILDFLRHTLFDPYMIILKDFRGCANALLGGNGVGVIVLYLPRDGYIIEVGRGSVGDDRLHVCTSDDYDDRLTIRAILMAIGISLSLLGLTATIASLVLAGEHRSVPGVNIICLSASLMTTYITVLVVNLKEVSEDCLSEGVTHVFAVLASVCWMNVMAYDIWSTLSAVRLAEEYSTRSHFRKSLSYCAYGWGLPATILVIGVILDHNDVLGESFKPRFSLACWFTEFNTWGTVIFYHGPIGLILVSNLVLFLLTIKVLRAATIPKNTAHHSSLRRGKYLFKLHIKLFVVMGLTWMLEILNLAMPSSGFMTAFDFINTMQGFFIFIIFGCKKPVLTKVYNVCACKAEFNQRSYYSYSSKYAGNVRNNSKNNQPVSEGLQETRI